MKIGDLVVVVNRKYDPELPAGTLARVCQHTSNVYWPWVITILSGWTDQNGDKHFARQKDIRLATPEESSAHRLASFTAL